MPLDLSKAGTYLQNLIQEPQEPPQAPGQAQVSMKWPMIAALAGQAADNISTNTTPSTWEESNPLLPDDHVANAMMQSLGTLGTLLAIKAIGKKHPTIAKLLGYGAGGVGAVDTMINMKNR